jgi:hypothetical protein
MHEGRVDAGVKNSLIGMCRQTRANGNPEKLIDGVACDDAELVPLRQASQASDQHSRWRCGLTGNPPMETCSIVLKYHVTYIEIYDPHVQQGHKKKAQQGVSEHQVRSTTPPAAEHRMRQGLAVASCIPNLPPP